MIPTLLSLRIWFVLATLFVFMVSMTGQESINVEGTVTDDSGEALPGVRI